MKTQDRISQGPTESTSCPSDGIFAHHTWRSAWRSLTQAAGLKGFRFHDLRHTAIAELAEAGAPDDATLMAIAGHLSRKMLEHYSHVRMEVKRQAVSRLNSGLMGKPEEEPVTAQKVN